MKKQKNHSMKLLILPLVLVIGLLLTVTTSKAAATYSPQLLRYPYLTDVVNSYATINCTTDQSNTTGAVRWGKVVSESCTAHYAPAPHGTEAKENGISKYQCKAKLNVLP